MKGVYRSDLSTTIYISTTACNSGLNVAEELVDGAMSR